MDDSLYPRFDLTPVDFGGSTQPQPTAFDLSPLNTQQSLGAYQPTTFDITPLSPPNIPPIPSHEPYHTPTAYETWDDAFSRGLFASLGPVPQAVMQLGDWFGGASPYWKAATQGTSQVTRLLDMINSSQQALFGAVSKDSTALQGMQQDYGYGDVMKSYGVEAPKVDPNGTFTFFKGTPYAVDTAFVPKTINYYAGKLAGNIVFDPMNLAGEYIARGVGSLASATGKLLKPIAEQAVEHPVSVAGISSDIIKPIAQGFSKTAYRTDAYNTAQKIIDKYITERAVHTAEYEHGMLRFEDEMRKYAESIGRPLDDVKREVLQIQETKLPISTAQGDTPLRPPMAFNQDYPKLTNSIDSLQPWLIDGLGMTRAEREIGAVKQAQEALVNLGYRVPEDVTRMVTEYKYPDVTIPDEIVQLDDKGNPLYRKKYTSPDRFSDLSPIPLTKIPANRSTYADSLVDEANLRGGLFYYPDHATKPTQLFSNLTEAEAGQTAVGGPNLFNIDLSLNRPLVLRGPDVMGIAGRDGLIRLKGYDYYSALEKEQSLGGGLSDFAHNELKSLVPNDYDKIIQKYNDLISTNHHYEASSLVEDRLASEWARRNGYDSIVAFTPRVPNKPNEIMMLDPVQAISREIKEHIFKPSLSDKVVQMGLQAKDWEAVRRATSAKIGFPEPELNDPMLDYALHRLTPEGEAWLVNKFEGYGYGRQFTPSHASQFARTLSPQGLTADEMNALVANGQGERISKALKGFDGKLWITDPAELNMIRELRTLRARTNFQILNDAANQLSRPGLPSPSEIKALEKEGLFHPEDYAPDHWRPLALTTSDDPRLKLISPLFENKYFPPEVAEKLNRFISLDAIPGIENHFLRYLDAAYNDVITNWKGTALNFSPAYWAKNVGSALYNAFVDGMYDTSKFALARKIIRGELEGSVNIGGFMHTAESLNQLRKDLGLGLGFATVEGAGLYEKQMPALFRLPVVGRAARKMYAVNQLTENTIRFGHFLGLLDQGVDMGEAISRVKAAQFDYLTGLTEFERLLKRYGMPFYTWSRFNLPFQIKGLITNPRPYIHLAQVVNMMKDSKADQRTDKYQELLPEYLKNLGIPTRIEDDGKVSIQVWGGWVPASDLEEILSPKALLGKAIQQLNPVLQQIGGQLFNKDPFFNRPLEEFPGQLGKFLGIDMRNRLSYFLRTIRPLQDADRIFKAYMDHRETMDERQQNAFRQFFRALHGVPSYKVDISDLYKRRRLQIEDLNRQRIKYMKKKDYANAKELEELIRDLRAGFQ